MELDNAQLKQLKGQTVAVFGGTGFVGKVLLQKLVDAGANVRLAIRRDPNQLQLPQAIIDSRQVVPIQFNLDDFSSIKKVCEGASYAVNLIGIFQQRKSSTFENIQVKGTQFILDATQQCGVERLVHISAMGASLDSSSSEYLLTKAKAETLLKIFPQTVILRPCGVFGETDNFTNHFVDMVLTAPVFFLFGDGTTRLQLVYVGDLAEAIIYALVNKEAAGKTYEIGGDEILSIKDIFDIIINFTHRKRSFIKVPFGFLKFVAYFLEFLPKPPITREIVKMMKQDCIVSSQSLTIRDLGVTPHKFADILPKYHQFTHHKGGI